MDAKGLFDFHAYINGLAHKNRLAVDNGFHFCTCAGINNLDNVLARYASKQNFICVDDTSNGSTAFHSGGWFKRRTFTVFLIMRYPFSKPEQRDQRLNLCRELLRQLHGRMIRDEQGLQNEMVYMDVNRVAATEISSYFLQGCTGLYFGLYVDEPVDLTYNDEEWYD